MYWLPIAELDRYKAFPSFMKEYLQTEHAGIEHIVSDERTEKYDIYKTGIPNLIDYIGR